MDALITTADWLRYIESLGPTDAESLRVRLETAGADPARASFLVSVWRVQTNARRVTMVAAAMLAIGLGAAAHQWWLALQGERIGHEPRDIYIVTAVIAVAAFALLLGSALQLSPPLDLSYREIPAGLGPPPRNVAIRRKRGASIGLGIAIVSFIVAPFTIAVIEVRNRVLLRDHGVETTGRVTETYVTAGSKGSKNYHVAYEFEQGHGTISVGSRQYGSYHSGDSIPVTYLPSNPDVNEGRHRADILRGPGMSDPLTIGVLFYIVAIAFFVVMLASMQDKRRLRLAERGVAVVAEVTGLSMQSVNYRFDDREGRFRWAKRKVRERPSQGQPLVILYDPENPKRNMPLGALGDVEFN